MQTVEGGKSLIFNNKREITPHPGPGWVKPDYFIMQWNISLMIYYDDNDYIIMKWYFIIFV